MENFANQLVELLYNKENGLLIKYHFNRGLDYHLLDKLYDFLETVKKEWATKQDVPKDVMYQLIGVVPALYHDLSLYEGKQEYYDYEEKIVALDTAVAMCLNPNTNDVHFNKPLKDLGYL
ncbi:hypothetical protein [Pseudochryseolinea flava]|uniref:Uncharacterized protein n=1 Tax=Pseudochryseolinea flava TaxID=2059302 RepID=A0A364Y7H0_9BACT|nr:hypothetical protein [Pseudochryseolinea flava]RAW02843.1 hypothetical protein DQQ10_01675 [Pseudochryseolinea flava]